MAGGGADDVARALHLVLPRPFFFSAVSAACDHVWLPISWPDSTARRIRRGFSAALRPTTKKVALTLDRSRMSSTCEV